MSRDSASEVRYLDNSMDNVVKEGRGEADDRFETARVTAAVDALAEKHAGREDQFRAALAQLLKAEMIAARATAQAILLKDRNGRRCAERLCFVQDEIIRILYDTATRTSIVRTSLRAKSAWRWLPPAAMAAG